MTESNTSNLPVVAYLGPRGTFSEAAVRQHFAEAARLLECATIDDVFLSVEQGKSEFGVVPVENSTEGAINNTQDCLIDSPVKIVGEEVVKIEHSLLVQPGVDISNVKRVASHKQSLAQCRQFLASNYPGLEQVECSSNAEAALRASDDPQTAAIAGRLAGEIYGLEAVAEQIQDQDHNRTRFLVLSKDSVGPTGRDRTSLLIYAENKPGALFRILEPFENLQISLTRIETRPSKKEAWAYVFFVDFEGHVDDELVQELFRRLETCTAEVKVLGSYPRASA